MRLSLSQPNLAWDGAWAELGKIDEEVLSISEEEAAVIIGEVDVVTESESTATGANHHWCRILCKSAPE